MRLLWSPGKALAFHALVCVISFLHAQMAYIFFSIWKITCQIAKEIYLVLKTVMW